MKKNIFILLFLFCLNSYSQSSDLAITSTGEFLGFSALFNREEQLFGYLAIYNKGKETPTTEKFEYVYFDKNLNKVANNDFINQSFITGYDPFINIKGEIELVPRTNSEDYGKAKKQTIATSKVINIKNNTISDKPRLDYENGKLVEIDLNQSRKDRDNQLTKLMKSNGYFLKSDVVELEDGTFLASIHKLDPYKGLKYDFAIIKYDSNKKELWRNEFNKNKKSKINQYIEIIYFDYKSIYLIEMTTVKKDVSSRLVKINLENNVKEIDIPITNYSEESLKSLKLFDNGIDKIYNKRSFEDKVVFIGRLVENLYSPDKGCFRIIIDKNTNEVKFSDLFYSEVQGFVNLNNSASKDSYLLMAKDFYFFNDTSVGIMFEKFKGGGVSIMGVGGGAKTTDLVYLKTNANFQLSDSKVFEKEKSKGYFSSDYLFSQYLNGSNDLAFFYRDYQKGDNGDKNWNLYINTIRSGVLSQEKIPISSKDNAIFPYVGKDGYILLREYNKKSNYNGIRLEKLNY